MDHDKNSRRSTDPIIFEIHGMVQRLDQKMDDTQKWFKSAHEAHLESDRINFEDIRKRIAPIDRVFQFLKIIWKPVTIASVPVIAGLGYLIWDKIRILISQ